MRQSGGSLCASPDSDDKVAGDVTRIHQEVLGFEDKVSPATGFRIVSGEILRDPCEHEVPKSATHPTKLDTLE